jgi:hypothetical protein
MTTKYTKWPLNICNGRKIDQMVICKINQDFPFQDPKNIYPNWDFWFENKPSGNPALYLLSTSKMPPVKM